MSDVPDLKAIRLKVDEALLLQGNSVTPLPEFYDVLRYTEALLGELKALDLKWAFEHELALDQEAEIVRLDAEVKWLQDHGRIPQLERLLFAAREVLDQYQTYVDGEGEDQNDEPVIAVCRDIDTLVGPPRPQESAS